MTQRTQNQTNTSAPGAMSLSEVLVEIPWPTDWCFEALLDRIEKRQEDKWQ